MRDESVLRLQEIENGNEKYETFETKGPSYTRPDWFDQPIKENYEGRCRAAVRAFVTGTFKGKMPGYGMNGSHTYTVRKDGSELWLFKNNDLKVRICVAKKVNGYFVGNSSSLWFQRSLKTGKPIPTSGGQLKIQEVMSDVMPMLPFGLFKDLKMDINTVCVVEKAQDEKFDLGRKVKKKFVLDHFTGAMVFKIHMKSRSMHNDRYYLFDVDRNDLKLKNLNFFLSRLSRPVTSIKDAYESLKPQEVYEAERFLGRPCERQGEWFFIPVHGEFKKDRAKSWGSEVWHDKQAVLQAKGNRAHYVEKLSVEGYVKGKVSHGGFEHKPIILDGWHKPVPNTAIESFKISGAID